MVTFFITFGVLEDSGYLPRLAVLTNRLFSLMGLNGQAVLPMVLGLGCVTMATMTTRILTSRRDRVLVTLLLALAVPCSAQLGVVMGLLAGISFSATLIWGGINLFFLFLVGWLAARLMPGQRAPLVVELPPLRFPVWSNVLIKTTARLEWYIKEAVPLFLFGTLLLFVLDWFHILPRMIQATEPLITGWLGLPPEAAAAFLLGLMRRDFAATGLFAMESQGLLDSVQVVVSIVTITLFIPCIASLFNRQGAGEQNGPGHDPVYIPLCDTGWRSPATAAGKGGLEWIGQSPAQYAATALIRPIIQPAGVVRSMMDAQPPAVPTAETTNINPDGSRLATFLVHLFGGTPHDPSSTIPAKRVSQYPPQTVPHCCVNKHIGPSSQR